MNTQFRNYVTSALLALPVALAMVAAPTAALAQPATPEVRSLEIGSDAGLAPGARLRFRLVGTPRVQANVRVRGLQEAVPLREVSPGVYVGGYTVKRADRLSGEAEVRATLRHGNRITAATYALSETMAAPVVVAPPPQVPRVPDPRIERFGISPLERIEPGADIRFALEGTPGGTVVVDLPGVTNDLRLRETRPGFYEGSYTIRRVDNFNPNRPIVATLRVGDRISTTNVPFPTAAPVVAGDNRPPNVLNLTPREGETVAGGPVLVSANFEDRGGSGVDPASVQIVVSGRNVTREAQVTTQGFSFRDALPPGRHSVEVTARDRAGNVVRRGWSFDVAAVVVPANVGVQVLNHGPNGQVGPGPTRVEARTAPRATVAVSVHAVTPTGGGMNVSQNLFQQTLQADPEGNFGFTFLPQIPIPGTRYDIVMVASRGNASQETRLSLFQR
jgi:hypothetical protein